jgi:flagellin
MISIQTNVNSLVAQQNLSVNSAFQSKTIQQLTSGYRINSSGDDAAGLAVANKYRSSVAELTQGVANGNDGVSQLQIMDGGMSNISMVLDRLKTLATQSASGAFTGSRATLNSEFQTDLGEIDRQAQSIGLNTGGTFAKNLQVYLGAGSGSQNIANATVNVDLTTASVDTQALGLKGFQAIGGTADLSSTSATSVSNIVNNAANKASVSTPGTSVLYVSGAGFSDSGKIALSVNLSSVTDTASLATAINAAISSSASGTTTAATNFKNANIVASVNTTAGGAQQISFTSSTQAFQVQAGDQMSNALLGNFATGSTGASLNTSVIGQAAASGATTLAAGQIIKVQISGGGLTSPQTLSIAQGSDATVGAAITDLLSQTTTGGTGTALAAAGITASQNASGQLVFTNSSNQQFNVEASGDTSNLLGLGAYALATGSTTTDYTTITAGAAYDKTGGVVTAGASASPQTSLQFSINGGTAVGIGAIALDGGNSTAGTYTTGAYTPTTITNANKAVSFTVDGQTVSGNLALDTPATSGNVVANNAFAAHDSSSTHTNFLLAVDGSGVKNIALTTNDTSEALYLTDINAAIVTAFGSGVAVATDNGAGKIQITSATTGSTSGISLGSGVSNDALSNIGFTTNLQGSGTAATTTSAASAATQVQALITAAALTGGAGATATVVTGAVVITNKNVGADHTLTAIAAGPLSGGTVAIGNNRTGDNLATAINTAISGNATLAAAGLSATWNAGASKLTIASSNNSSFRVNAGSAPVKGTTVGTVDLTSGADFSKSPATLSVSVDGGAAQTVTLNQNYATASTLAAAITGQLTGATASVVSLNGKNYLQVVNSSSGPTHSVQVQSTGSANSTLGFTDNTAESGSNEVNIGFGVSNTSDAGTVGLAAASSALSVVNAAGTTQTGGLTFSGLTSGTQALTFAGNNSNNATQSLTVTLAATGSGTASLQNDGSGANIDQAVAYINTQLQKTNNSTLQSIVAVKQSVGGQEEINFVSPLPSFQVGIGTSKIATQGLNGGVAETATANVTGTASNISIATQSSAEAAITAIGNAVSALGSAQAEVGKGENQLGYAITLASSQSTNLSAAESQIRDANVAQQAANLSKAQVLSQASIAAMAQANSAPQGVLALLRG